MRIVRSIYDHHMIAVEVKDSRRLTVIHFNAKKMFDFANFMPEFIQAITNIGALIGGFLKCGIMVVAKVRKQTLYVNTTSETVQVLGYLPNEKVFDKAEILERAHQNLGRTDYNLFSNNCESMINTMAIGRPASNQTKNAVIFFTGFITVLFISIIIGIFLHFRFRFF